jgi:hypothetical protein
MWRCVLLAIPSLFAGELLGAPDSMYLVAVIPIVATGVLGVLLEIVGAMEGLIAKRGPEFFQYRMAIWVSLKYVWPRSRS